VSPAAGRAARSLRLVDELAGTAVVLAGITFLASRPLAPGSPGGRTVLFAVGYVAVGLASLNVPAGDRTNGPVSAGAALAVGAAAVALAALAAGSPIPAPWGAAALPLSLVAAVAEEALFRRAAYARLLPLGAVAAVVGSAVLFALIHLPAYGVAALPVDLGAGLLLSWQRWASGTWTVPAATHALANLLAVAR
jgi:membrane protease YdiL (CAAX protease family)